MYKLYYTICRQKLQKERSCLLRKYIVRPVDNHAVCLVLACDIKPQYRLKDYLTGLNILFVHERTEKHEKRITAIILSVLMLVSLLPVMPGKLEP